MIWIIRQVLFFWKLLQVNDTPRCLALGLASGVLLGLIPKGNLLAIGIASVVFAVRVNIPVATTAAFVISLAGTWLDPMTHRLGQAVLTQSMLTPIWQWLYQQPFTAWTSFNNTVVMGNLLLGSALFYPTYRLSLPWFARYRQWFDLREERAADDSQPTVAIKAVAEASDKSLPDVPPAVPIGSNAAATQDIIPRRTTPRLRKCA